MLLLSADFFFKINFLKKKIFQEHYQCKMVWIQIRTSYLLVLIWVQIVYKGCQQTTKVAASKKHFNMVGTILAMQDKVKAITMSCIYLYINNVLLIYNK